MQALRALILYSFFLLISFAANAQIDRSPFPHDSLAFFDHLEGMFKELTVGKAEGKDFIKEFEPIWFSDFFEPEIREVIYNTCDNMNEKRMLPLSEFRAYLVAVTAFVNSGQEIEQFYSWHSAVDFKLLGKSKRRYYDFLVFSQYLFDENALYKTNITTWKSDNSNYKIYWDDELRQPVVKIDELDLICLAKKDSASIYETKGMYYPDQKLWKGYGGIVNWQRAGYEENQLVAKIKSYEVQMNHSSYKADSAIFSNAIYFGSSKLIGDLEDKVLANVSDGRSTYPRFDSYNDNLAIENIFPKVDYHGGFIQRGSSFIGKGSDEKLARVVINRNGKPFIEAFAHTFVIRESKLTADPAEVLIYLDGDTIFHPGLNFKFDNDKRTLTLYRNKVGRSKAPFFNHFHNLDMYCEEIVWNVDGNMFHLKPLLGNTDRSALFESKDYYRAYRYDELYGLDNRHPLVILKKCSEEMGSTEMTASDIAACWHLPFVEVQRSLMVLSNVGFVRYNYDSKMVTILPKTFNYVQARLRKRDYDIIQIVSDPPKRNDRQCVGNEHNADFNLDSSYMQIHGVRGINLSDSHNVTIFPLNCEILLRPNRDFDFSGVVVAGNLEFFGRDFKFEYDSFQIKMPVIDSMRINVETEEMDEYGKPIMKRVKTVIEAINGKLEVDKYNNKSGKRAIKRWPVFTSYNESYTYYDRPEIEGGVYNREDFYFKLEPFEFDSLDNFENSSIQFAGTFKSAGIFEDFEETLSLQTDFSLGFIHPTPDEGMPIYDGKGTFTADILLSHEGLKGAGYVDYITSTTESQSFFFHPDSAYATAEQFVIESQYPGPPEYPNVEGVNIDWHWHPYHDTMTVANYATPFSMYEADKTFDGTLIYHPDSLIGTGKGDKRGKFEFDKAITVSNEIRFKFFEFFADTADFALKTGSLGELGFDTKNINAHVSFKDRIGHFTANSEESSEIIFRKNEYMARMDAFTWYMDDDILDLTAKKRNVNEGADGEVEIEGAKLVDISKHDKPNQDSLFFYSSSCKFDIKNEIITADKVPYLDVADSRIIPDSGRIIVLRAAKIKTLKNAQVIANRENKFHKIYGATMDVSNKVSFKGSGKYDYKDVDGNVAIIELNDVFVSTQLQTNASGNIPKTQEFFLNSRFRFQGGVSLESSKELLSFSGLTQIIHSCDQLSTPWIQFNAYLDPNEILIPIDSNTTTENGKRVHVGQMMGSLPSKVYSLFGALPAKPTDAIISSVEGVMGYNFAQKEFRVGSEQKINIPNLTGNYFVLQSEECIVKFEGEHSWGADLGRMELRPVSRLRHNLNNDSVTLETSMLLNFFFEDKAMKILAKDFEESENERVDYDDATYGYGLKTYVGEEAGNKIKADVGLTGKMKKIPNELTALLFITNMDLYWNPQKIAFQSVGKIGLGNSYKNQVNRLLEGKFEIKIKRSGDRFMLQIKKDKTTYYFFTYSVEIMQTVSTNDKYNVAIKEAKKTKQERSKGQAKYKFIPTTKAKANQLIRQF